VRAPGLATGGAPSRGSAGERPLNPSSRARAAAGSALFLLLAPGVVAGVVPWWMTGWRAGSSAGYVLPLRVVGGLLVVVGAGVLLQAFGRFVMEGVGTPAPVAPTRRLVVGGLYRHVRNPMYLAVLSMIVGQALLLRRPVLLAYAAGIAAAFVAFVRFYEEPTLARQFGEEYQAYRRAVPGWLPRLRPWE
jgi:protein-S-isoprenylcysteine O-methyltransferase Ste14